MKKYLKPHILVKLGLVVTSGLACQALFSGAFESRGKINLTDDWNSAHPEKKSAFSSAKSSSAGFNQMLFPIEADLPRPKPIYNIPSAQVSQEISPEKETPPKESISQQEDAAPQTKFEGAQSTPILLVSEETPEESDEKAPEKTNSDELEPLQNESSIEAKVLAQGAEVPSSTETSKASPPLPIAIPSDSGSVLDDKGQPILIRFNNVSIIEYLRFISGISHKNFIFDENDLQFTITMISEEPTSIDDFMGALLQELRIHDLTLLEQGNNVVIHKNPRVNNVSSIVTDEGQEAKTTTELVTQIFRLNTADAEKVAGIIRPLISEKALVDVIKDSNHLILTDLVSNVAEISKLIKSIDSPKGGLVIGQYVVRTSSIDVILPILQQLMGPITAEQSIQYVPYTSVNSVFIVSTPFLVERALSILQHLDQNQKSTKILDLNDLRYSNLQGEDLKKASRAGIYINDNPFEASEETPQQQNVQVREGANGWKIDDQGNWTFKVLQSGQVDANKPPQGKWSIDQKGNWLFTPGGIPESGDEQKSPKGRWELDAAGNWEFDLDENEGIGIHVLTREAPENEELLPSARPKGQFFFHKVHYRKGEDLERSLQSMSDSLRETENIDPDLVNALSSVQWLESSNSLIFSGTPQALKKIASLIEQIDVPLRQVFIEMLILEVSLVDALNYGVKWGNRFAGGNWAGADGFDSTFPSPLSAAMDQSGVTNLGKPVTINPATALPVLAQIITPNPIPFNGSPGFDIGVIGQRIFNKLTGIEFESMAAFINCLRAVTTSNIILNPKIITQDGIPAEIFVGENIAYQTQSIVNDQGVILTSNFEYRDVGTRLKVTPYLGASDIIALEVENEITNVISNAQAGLPANSNVGPNTSKSSTVTRVQVPSGFFVVISGMLRDETRRSDAHAPCLGGIPILGGAFKDKKYEDQKRNLMIFIQPTIIDTDEDLQNLTKRQQDILKTKNRRKKDMLYETEEFMDFLNLKKYEHERTSLEFEDDEEPL